MEASEIQRKNLLRDRRKAISGLKFYLPASVVTLAIFWQVPSWGTGIIFGLALVSLMADSSVLVACTLKSRLASATPHSNSGMVKCGDRHPRGEEGLETFKHRGLGVLTYNSDVGLWQGKSEMGGVSLGFAVAGRQQPDPALLQEVIDILRDHDDFMQRITLFLQSEMSRMPEEYSEEIRGLIADEIVFSSQKHPSRGMLYFAGGDDEKVWRCDLVNKVPRLLGFDD